MTTPATTPLVKPVAALGGSGVVVNRADGRPLPPSDVVRKLEAYDPELSVRFVNGVRGWAVCRRWKDDDPRRLLIQKGEINPESDYTILTFLPHDCSVAEAFNYIAAQARHQAHDKEYWANLVLAMLAENEKHSDDLAAKATEELDDYIDAPMGFGRSELPRVASSEMDNRPAASTDIVVTAEVLAKVEPEKAAIPNAAKRSHHKKKAEGGAG